MNRGFGIAGFISSLLSIASLFLSMGALSGILGLIFGILGLVLCVIQLKKQRTVLAIAGLVISIIGIIAGVNVFSGLMVRESVKNSLDSNSAQLEDMAKNIGK